MKEWSFLIVRALVTLLALTNRILVVCYVKIVGKTFFVFSQAFFMFDTGIFLCSVYYYFN